MLAQNTPQSSRVDSASNGLQRVSANFARRTLGELRSFRWDGTPTGLRASGEGYPLFGGDNVNIKRTFCYNVIAMESPLPSYVCLSLYNNAWPAVENSASCLCQAGCILSSPAIQIRPGQAVKSAWSTLIGRGMSRLVSHWSRAS